MLYLVADINFMCITKMLFSMFCDQKKAEEDLKLLIEVPTAAVWINETGRDPSPVEDGTIAQFSSHSEQGGHIQTVFVDTSLIHTKNQA